MVLICMSLIAKDVEHLLKCLLVIHIPCFDNILFGSMAHFLLVSCLAFAFFVYSSCLVGFIAVKDFLPFCGPPCQSIDSFICCKRSLFIW